MHSISDFLIEKVIGRRNGTIYVPHHLYVICSHEFIEECDWRNIKIEVVSKYDKRSLQFVPKGGL